MGVDAVFGAQFAVLIPPSSPRGFVNALVADDNAVRHWVAPR